MKTKIIFAMLMAAGIMLAACSDDPVNTVTVRDEVHGKFSIEALTDPANNMYRDIEIGFDSIKIRLMQNGEVFQEVYSDSNRFTFKQVPHGKYDMMFYVTDDITYLKKDITIGGDTLPNLYINGVFPVYSNILYKDTISLIKIKKYSMAFSPDSCRIGIDYYVMSDSTDVEISAIDANGNIIGSFNRMQMMGFNSLGLYLIIPENQLVIARVRYSIKDKQYLACSTLICEDY